MTCSPTSTPIATASAANSACTAVDVLTRLQRIIDRTPAHALVTHPISRTLLAEAASEIQRLRTEHQQLLARKEPL